MICDSGPVVWFGWSVDMPYKYTSMIKDTLLFSMHVKQLLI